MFIKLSSLVNKVIKILIISDIFVISAFTIFAPVFAIFVNNQIIGASVRTVGFAIAIYWIVRTFIQLPIAKFLDRYNGERDDFLALVFGSILFSVIPILYIFIKYPWQIYILHGFFGLADSLVTPAYLSIFSRHLTPHRVSFEWSLRSVAIGVGSAAVSAFGGTLADVMGFNYVFILIVVLSMIGSIILISLHPYLYKNKDGKGFDLNYK